MKGRGIALIGLGCLVLLSGCASDRYLKLPDIQFDMYATGIEQAQTDKVSLNIISFSKYAELQISNGLNQSIQILDINIAAERCRYEASTYNQIGPGFRMTYNLPDVGVLGLCFDDDKQQTFYQKSFINISTSSSAGDVSLPMTVHLNYLDASTESHHLKQKFYLNFR